MRLGDIAQIIISNVDKKSNAGERTVRLCNYTDVYKRDTIDPAQAFMEATATATEIKKFGVKAGDVIITKDSETADDIAMPTYVLETADDLVCGYHLAIIRPDREADGRFLKYFFELPQTRHYFGTRANGAIRFGLTIEGIEGAKILLPSIEEQRRIADILRTWDEAIEKLEALKAAKERRQEALREKLAFADAAGEPKRLADVTKELIARNGDNALGRDLVMGITNSRGIVPMREQTIADDISRYKLFPHRAFAYNPMRVNVGSIAMNETKNTILVSPDYVVFACIDGELSADFLDHLRKTRWWAHYVNSGGSGSVRQRTYYADLAAMKVPLPGFEKQHRLAGILDTGRQDIEATAREITALRRQKRGLMQKLLTGEWRVKVNSHQSLADEKEAALG